MQVTVKNLIVDALTMLMVYSPDTILTAEENNTALRTLNSLIESMANDPLTINSITAETFNLVGGKKTYTFGTGGDFNSSRPISVKAVTTAITGTAGNIDFPVVIVQYDDYAAIQLKTLQTNYPQYVYFDGSYPLENVSFYPVPSSVIPVTIYSTKQLTEFTDITNTVSFPQGYYRMLVALLAIELAPSYQLTASQNIFDIAQQAKRSIIRTNQRPLTMQTAVELTATGGRYNIFSDKQK
jgi:hypothetical protein